MLKNKVVVITGASSGIGKAVAIDCAKAGANVVLVARSKEKLDQVSSEIQKYNVKSLCVPIDVSRKKEVAEAMSKILGTFEKIDVLINNAGIGVYGNFVEKDIRDMEQVVATNLFGTIYMTKAILPLMLKQGYGHIVNVGSVVSKMGISYLSDYCASKFAVAGLSESLYQELKPLGIDVSVVYPGYVKTNFHNHPSFKGMDSSSPVKGIEPEDVSKIILKALKQKKFEYFVPRFYGPLMKSKGVFPSTFRKIQLRRSKISHE